VRLCPACGRALAPFSLTIRVQAADEIRARVRQVVARNPRGGDTAPPLTEADKQEVVLAPVPAWRCGWCRTCYYAPEVDEVVRLARRYLMPPKGARRMSLDEARAQLAHVLRRG
jgi:hypothetical protein